MWSTTNYIFFVLPAFLDFILEKLNFYTNLGELRVLTGLLLGIAVFQLLLVSFSMESQKNESNSLKRPPSLAPSSERRRETCTKT
jgi:hypothetical protein